MNAISKRMSEASRKMRKESMRVNAEFARIERRPDSQLKKNDEIWTARFPLNAKRDRAKKRYSRPVTSPVGEA